MNYEGKTKRKTPQTTAFGAAQRAICHKGKAQIHFIKERFFMNCNCGFGGGNCCWIIIILLVLFFCCGNGGSICNPGC